MENSKSARQCKKDGGYFNCSYWWLDMFEEACNKLIRDGLPETKTSEICDSKSKKNPCLYCSMNAMCKNQIRLQEESVSCFQSCTIYCLYSYIHKEFIYYCRFRVLCCNKGGPECCLRTFRIIVCKLAGQRI